MKKKLITSALPYVNNVPHLGNIIGSVLSADVYARYCRLRGYETFYVCGTDEYGTATETKAMVEGTTPQAICDQYFKIHQEIYRDFNISFDYFGRTSTAIHGETTTEIFNELYQNGFILEEQSQQLFCETDQIFLADRYVEGTCPNCGFTDARGDQCDNCSKLLQPTELIEPRCKICQSKPVLKNTKHLYLNLKKLAPQIESFVASSRKAGAWAENAISTTQAWLTQGLEARPITRDLKWGVPVPLPEYKDKVFYVWFDAVMGYISFTKAALQDSWKTWWQKPAEVELYQFMAKDNIPFHSIVFPAMLLGSNSKWTMLHHLASSEYLNYESKKFSKSRQIGVFGNDIKAIGIAVDWWRFYLLANRPEVADTNFSWDDFLLEINSNFIDNIGNLLNRTLALANNDLFKPDYVKFSPQSQEFQKTIQALKVKIIDELELAHLRGSLRQVLELGRLSNKIFQESAPWKLLKNDPDRYNEIILLILVVLKEIALLLLPFVPDIAEQILTQLGVKERKIEFKINWALEANQKIGPAGAIFNKLEPEFIAELSAKFSGSVQSPAIQAFLELEIVVGCVVALRDHPTNPRLSIYTIELGAGRHVELVSALKEKYDCTKLLNKNCLILANLEPRQFDGISSEGMLLTLENRKSLEPIIVEAVVGSIVTLSKDAEGASLKPLTQLEKLKTAGIKASNGLMTVDGKQVFLMGAPIKTGLLNAKVT